MGNSARSTGDRLSPVETYGADSVIRDDGGIPE